MKDTSQRAGRTLRTAKRRITDATIRPLNKVPCILTIVLVLSIQVLATGRAFGFTYEIIEFDVLRAEELRGPSRLNDRLFVEEIVRPPAGNVLIIVELSYSFVREEGNEPPVGTFWLVLDSGELLPSRAISDYFHFLSDNYLPTNYLDDAGRMIGATKRRLLFVCPSNETPTACRIGDFSFPITEIRPYEEPNIAELLPECTIVEAIRHWEFTESKGGLERTPDLPDSMMLELFVDIYDPFEVPQGVRSRQFAPGAFQVITINGDIVHPIFSRLVNSRGSGFDRKGYIRLSKLESNPIRVLRLKYLLPKDESGQFKLSYFGEIVDTWSFGHSYVAPERLSDEPELPEQVKMEPKSRPWFLVALPIVILAAIFWYQWRRRSARS